jgi:hypothetical protein
MALVVTLDSQKYVVKDRSVRGGGTIPIFTSAPIRPFVEAIETSGRPDSASVTGRTSLDFPNLFDGFGRDRIDADSAAVASEYRRCDYSTCDIRFAHGIRLPILEEDSTETDLEVIRASAAFKSNLWAAWEDGTSTQVLARKYVGSTTSWNAGGRIRTVPTFDAATTSTTDGFSHITTTRADRLMLLAFLGGTEPTAITYGGQSMTKITSTSVSSAEIAIWKLTAPSTGSNTITMSGESGINEVAVVTYSNVDQTTPVETQATAGDSSTAATVTASSMEGRLVFGVVGAAGSGTATVGADQTQRVNAVNTRRLACSEQGADNSSTVMSWTLASSVAWRMYAIPINGGGTGVGLDMHPHKNRLLSLNAFGESHTISFSTDGVTWAAPITNIVGGLLSHNVTANEGTITFFSSPDAGTKWTDEAIDVASGNGPQGVAVMNGIDNAQKLYVGTREGLYEVDTAPSTWTADLIFPLTPNSDNCRRMAVGQDSALWFTQGVDDDSVPIVYRMFTHNGTREFEPVPNDFSLGDGLPSAQLGPIRRMVPAQRMMYVTVGGGKVGRFASVFVHNGRGWSSMREHGTENQKIEWIAASGDDDATPRLHYAIRTATSTSDTKFLGQPFVNPNTGVTVKRESTGKILYPYVDAGFPLDQGPWLQLAINAEDLAATNSDEYVSAKFGTGDAGALAARTTTTLGDFLSGTRRLDIVSGTGVLAITFGVELILHRGSTNTKTPILKDFSIAVVKEPPERERWEMTIDIAATVLETGRTAENIVGDFETTRAPGLLRAFTYGPMTTARRVKVDSAPWRPTVTVAASTPGAVIAGADIQRGGEIDLVLSERI